MWISSIMLEISVADSGSAVACADSISTEQSSKPRKAGERHVTLFAFLPAVMPDAERKSQGCQQSNRPLRIAVIEKSECRGGEDDEATQLKLEAM